MLSTTTFPPRVHTMAVSAAFVRPLPRALRPALPLRIRTLHASPPRLSATAAEASSIVLSLSPSAMATAATVVAAPASPVKKGLVVEAKDSKGGNFVVRIQVHNIRRSVARRRRKLVPLADAPTWFAIGPSPNDESGKGVLTGGTHPRSRAQCLFPLQVRFTRPLLYRVVSE